MEVPTIEDFNRLESLVGSLQKKISQLEELTSFMEWVNVKTAAKMIDRTEWWVRDLAKQGVLVKKQGKRKMEISLESIRKYNKKYVVNA